MMTARWTRSVAVAAVLLMAATGALAGQQVSQNLRSAFARAETLIRIGQADEAVEPLTTVIDALLPAAQAATIGDEGRALLVRSLAYRADAYLFDGERGSADADFEQLLTLYPRASIEGFGLSDAGIERFDRAVGSLIGTLTFSPFPMDARIRVDGEDLPAGTTSFRVIAGAHYVEAFLPGFTRFAEEIEARADRSTEVEFELNRISAVIKLMTRPAGATVVIDGSVVGQTSGTAPRDWTPTPDLARYPRHEFSGLMEVEGLMPGQHEVEIILDGYRTFSAPIEIPDLADFQVGTVVLDRNLGTILLRDLSPEAEVWVDGRRTQPEPPSRGAQGDIASDAYRLSLPPGQYRVTVSQADAGVFEEDVMLADQRSMALSVRLRPGLTFVGVVGADRLGADALEGSLQGALGNLDAWTFLDRSQEAERLLQRTGATVDRLRAAAAPGADSAAALDWASLQSTMSRELPGSVFVLGVLGEDELAADADLWIWPSAPGPAVAERVRVSLSDPADMDALAANLTGAVRFERPWSGMDLIDSTISSGPVIAGVIPGGPAETAGVPVGANLVSVAGNLVANAADAQSWFDNFSPGSRVALIVRDAVGEQTIELRLGSGPLVIAPNEADRLYAAAWGLTGAAVGRMDAQAPTWVSQLNQAAVLLHARDWDAAAELLRTIQAPEGAGVGQGMVSYWLGVALAESGDVVGARAALEAAAAQPEARYLSNDGTFIAPLARVRLQALDAGQE